MEMLINTGFVGIFYLYIHDKNARSAGGVFRNYSALMKVYTSAYTAAFGSNVSTKRVYKTDISAA